MKKLTYALLPVLLILFAISSCQDDMEANLPVTTNLVPIDCESRPENCPGGPSNPESSTKQTAINAFKSSRFYDDLYSDYRSRLNYSAAQYSYSSTDDVTSLMIPLTGGTLTSRQYLDVAIPGKPSSSCLKNANGSCMSDHCINMMYGMLYQVDRYDGKALGSSVSSSGRIGNVYIKNAKTGKIASRFSVYGSGISYLYDYTETPGDIPRIGCTSQQAGAAEKCLVRGMRRNAGKALISAFICPECVVLGVAIGYVDCYLRHCTDEYSLIDDQGQCYAKMIRNIYTPH